MKSSIISAAISIAGIALVLITKGLMYLVGGPALIFPAFVLLALYLSLFIY